jgi:hypothetical protein
VATAKRVLVLFIVLQSCDLFRPRSFLQPAHERGLHWRGGLLRMTKVAIRAARAPGRARGPQPGLRPHAQGRVSPAVRRRLLVAAVMACGWIVGTFRGAITNDALHIGVAAVVLVSLSIAATELRRFPLPYDDEPAER